MQESGIRFESVKVIRGEGQLIMVRGKRKLGYEMDLEIDISQND